MSLAERLTIYFPGMRKEVLQETLADLGPHNAAEGLRAGQDFGRARIQQVQGAGAAAAEQPQQPALAYLCHRRPARSSPARLRRCHRSTAHA